MLQTVADELNFDHHKWSEWCSKQLALTTSEMDLRNDSIAIVFQASAFVIFIERLLSPLIYYFSHIPSWLDLIH